MNTDRSRQAGSSARRIRRTALAAAVGLGLASSGAFADQASRAEIRLSLDDVISSRPDTPAAEAPVDDRIAVHGLIQSHPDPLLVQLEQRYQALPPFTEAEEDSPEQYIAEATLGEEVAERARNVVEDIAGFVPSISSTVRYENVDNVDVGTRGGTPVMESYTTAIASVTPTFEYKRRLDRWQMAANYNYSRKQYFMDRSASLNDHDVNVKLRRRLTRGSEFQVTSRWVNTNDRTTNDPIAESGLDLAQEDLENQRYILNFGYSKGTNRDRTRIRITSFNERASLDTSIDGNAWNLNENGLYASYTWQARRQFSLVAEGRYARADYDIEFRDNTQLRTLVGSDMVLMNRRLRAGLRVGYERKTFDVAQGERDFGVPVWQGELELAWRRNTRLKLSTGRELYEQLQFNDAIDNNVYNVQEWLKASWQQNWNDHLTSDIGLIHRSIDFRGQDNKRTGHLLMASASYQMTNKLKLSLNTTFSRDTSSFGSDLSSNAITFRTDYSL